MTVEDPNIDTEPFDGQPSICMVCRNDGTAVDEATELCEMCLEHIFGLGEAQLVETVREQFHTSPVTEADIEAARTPNGGWSRGTLAAWGVSWPPPSGWKKRLLEGRAHATGIQP